LKLKQEPIEAAKRNAGLAAVEHVKDGSIVGLGSGSTVAFAIEALGEKIRRENLRVLGVPTSYQSFLLAVKHKIPVTTLEEYPVIDVTIDGADQIDTKLNLIKGMGAALAREKIVASASKLNIIIADESKKVKFLGESDHPVPVEVLPFGISLVRRKIAKMGGKPILREGKGKVGPVITDNGNVVLDVVFGLIEDPEMLETKLRMIPGVVETGLFVGLADVAIFGSSSGIKRVEKKRKQ
jgi:ribose 5-phosphate isomerase A